MIFPTDRYIRFDELTVLLQRLAETYPNLVEISSIGKSYEGRDIWCATVTDKASGMPDDKPAVWCDANIHATEVSPTTALTYLLDQLTTLYGVDEDITRAVRTKTFYVIPRVNPDGAELFLADSPEAIRSSTRPYPFDDEPLAGLKRQDIDGNGRLLQMRIADPEGPWKCHPDEPRLMIRRDATERGGTYYRLLPEGIVLDPDPDILAMAPTRHGLDLNRNFPGHWRGESEQYGAGPYPTSEPEARALVDFIAKHPNICHALT
ncbi:MAG: M14 family metallopeptidase, partial [Armatimonadota bacterium]